MPSRLHEPTSVMYTATSLADSSLGSQRQPPLHLCQCGGRHRLQDPDRLSAALCPVGVRGVAVAAALPPDPRRRACPDGAQSALPAAEPVGRAVAGTLREARRDAEDPSRRRQVDDAEGNLRPSEESVPWCLLRG